MAALETQSKPTVASIKTGITQYALRQLVDFDKYHALEKVDSLKTISRELKDEKADYYATVYAILAERIEKPKEQFKQYMLSLLGDKDYDKILNSLSKVDKTYRDDKKAPVSTATNSVVPPFSPPVFLRNQIAGQYPLPPGSYGFSAQHVNPFNGGVPGQHRGVSRGRFCDYCYTAGHTAYYCYKRRAGTQPYRRPEPYNKNN